MLVMCDCEKQTQIKLKNNTYNIHMIHMSYLFKAKTHNLLLVISPASNNYSNWDVGSWNDFGGNKFDGIIFERALEYRSPSPSSNNFVLGPPFKMVFGSLSDLVAADAQMCW